MTCLLPLSFTSKCWIVAILLFVCSVMAVCLVSIVVVQLMLLDHQLEHCKYVESSKPNTCKVVYSPTKQLVCHGTDCILQTCK